MKFTVVLSLLIIVTPTSACYDIEVQGKKVSNDQELIQLDPISCPQNQKGNNEIHKLTAVYERHAR